MLDNNKCSLISYLNYFFFIKCLLHWIDVVVRLLNLFLSKLLFTSVVEHSATSWRHKPFSIFHVAACLACMRYMSHYDCHMLGQAYRSSRHPPVMHLSFPCKQL